MNRQDRVWSFNNTKAWLTGQSGRWSDTAGRTGRWGCVRRWVDSLLLTCHCWNPRSARIFSFMCMLRLGGGGSGGAALLWASPLQGLPSGWRWEPGHTSEVEVPCWALALSGPSVSLRCCPQAARAASQCPEPPSRSRASLTSSFH